MSGLIKQLSFSPNIALRRNLLRRNHYFFNELLIESSNVEIYRKVHAHQENTDWSPLGFTRG
jgi:hypothetical protein